MRKTITSYTLHGLCFIALSSAAISCDKQRVLPELAKTSYTPNFVLAKTGNELLKLQEDPKTNLLRTPQDYKALLESGGTPLSKLSKEVQEAFGTGIVYRPGIGVAGVDFSSIKALLTYDEFAQVLATFGMDVKQGYFGLSRDPAIIAQLAMGGGTQTGNFQDDQLMTDYEGYKCSGPHTCTAMADVICMSSCDK